MRLTTTPDRDDSPAWSPDGRYIAFLRIAPTLAVGTKFSIPADVFVMPALGGAERHVASITVTTTGPYFANSHGRPMRWLAISGGPSPADAAGIWLMEVDGPATNVSRRPRAGCSTSISVFAPDGRRLVFIRGGDMVN